MAEFAYNNAKYTNTGHTPFKLNFGYHSCVFFKEDINFRFQSKTANKLLAELRELMTVFQEKLYYA